MSRKGALRQAAFALAALAATSSSLVLADDNSMTRLTGDSYAFFNNLDYNPGKFNTAKAANERDMGVARAGKDPGKDPGKDVGKVEQRPTTARPSSAASTVFTNDTGA